MRGAVIRLQRETFCSLLQGKETNRNSNGHNAQSVETEPLFIASLAPHLGLKSVSELNWEGLVAENAGDIGKTIVREAAKHEVDLIVMVLAGDRTLPHCLVRPPKQYPVPLPVQCW